MHAPASPDARDHLTHVLHHLGHFLPDQGPIGVFVHHNTLHAFQHLPFHDAIAESARVFQTRGYLSESAYRQHFRQGRIRRIDVEAALEARWRRMSAAGVVVDGPLRERERSVMFHPVTAETSAGARWLVEENDGRWRLRADLEAARRAALLEGGRREFLAAAARVGQDWSFAAFVDHLTGADVTRRIQAALGDPAPRRWFERGAAAAATTIAGQAGETYLSFLRSQLGDRAERWVVLEADWAAPEAARRFGGTGSLPSLAATVQQDPERAVAAWLWGVASQTQPRDRAVIPVVDHPTSMLRALTGEDADDLVNPAMIRWTAAFLDEGQAHWAMPGREVGMFRAWASHVATAPHAVAPWLADLRDRARRLCDLDAIDAILATLNELAIPQDAWEDVLLRSERALPGWAGMMHRLERIPTDQAPGAPPASLADYLAVRLQYEVLAWQWLARRHADFAGPLRQLIGHLRSQTPAVPAPAVDDAWTLFQLAQVLGLTPAALAQRTTEARYALIDTVHRFGPAERARVWQEAYERTYRDAFLAVIAANRERRRAWLDRAGEHASAQVLFCIDDREEAIRRHLEEIDPSVETLGVAGFFGVAMDFCGIDDFAAAPLCPVVVTPGHQVDEVAAAGHEAVAARRAQRRSWIARALLAFNRRSRGLASASLIAIAGGALALAPFAARVFAPRWTGKVKKQFVERLVPVPMTVFTGLAQGDRNDRGLQIGFHVEEQAARVGATLENVGLTRSFGRYVVLMGHGSVSVNNPHQSAYDCGACGGRHGGPNARLFAEMANNPAVRAILARERGIHIPPETRFVGAFHNTCTDAIELYAVDPAEATSPAWMALERSLELARRMSAHERCRRFASAPRDPTPELALAHVEERSEDLSQARPELGHVTNAACVVGRRALTRATFLDRRAFLVSYDPTIDPSGAIIERILLAVGPVGAGINLEYYFSCVDNLRHGAGTKLPHNLTGLLGVMDGASSDLRTGLPRQMIEIHEPIRLLLVVEAAPEVLIGVVERQPIVAELVVNEWVQVASVHPETGEICRFIPGEGFVPWQAGPEDAPATVARSTDWYRGHEGFLPPALVRAAADRPPGYEARAARPSDDEVAS